VAAALRAGLRLGFTRGGSAATGRRASAGRRPSTGRRARRACVCARRRGARAGA